jgi:hypothetical protein
MLPIKKFMYESQSGVKARKVLVTEMPVIKGKTYVRGFDLAAMPKELEEKWEKIAPYLNINEQSQITFSDLPEGVDKIDITEGMKYFRIYDKNKVQIQG